MRSTTVSKIALFVLAAASQAAAASEFFVLNDTIRNLTDRDASIFANGEHGPNQIAGPGDDIETFVLPEQIDTTWSEAFGSSTASMTTSLHASVTPNSIDVNMGGLWIGNGPDVFIAEYVLLSTFKVIVTEDTLIEYMIEVDASDDQNLEGDLLLLAESGPWPGVWHNAGHGGHVTASETMMFQAGTIYHFSFNLILRRTFNRPQPGTLSSNIDFSMRIIPSSGTACLFGFAAPILFRRRR